MFQLYRDDYPEEQFPKFVEAMENVLATLGKYQCRKERIPSDSFSLSKRSPGIACLHFQLEQDRKIVHILNEHERNFSFLFSSI